RPAFFMAGATDHRTSGTIWTRSEATVTRIQSDKAGQLAREREQIRLAQQGDRRALAALMKENRDLERRVVKELHWKWPAAPKEVVTETGLATDLELRAREGLYTAIMNYDL